MLRTAHNGLEYGRWRDAAVPGAVAPKSPCCAGATHAVGPVAAATGGAGAR